MLTSAQAALARLGDHAARCPTCRTRDADGVNANLPCAESDRLYDAYRRTTHDSPPDTRGMQEHVRSKPKE